MRNMRLLTTVLYAPRLPKKEIRYIVRNSPEKFKFELSDKLYSFKDIKQLLLLFKQNNRIFRFNLFDYFVFTRDTTAISDKLYYTRHEINSVDSQYVFTEIKLEPGTEIQPNTYFEKCEPLNENFFSDNRQINPKFEHTVSSTEDCILCTLSPDDTAAFTCEQNNYTVDSEFAVRLGYNLNKSAEKFNPVLISKQPDIIVCDSILDNSLADRLTCPNDLYCSNEQIGSF